LTLEVLAVAEYSQWCIQFIFRIILSGVDGRIILRWIFSNWDVRVWTGSSWLRIGTGGGYL
jgi:hypothetical protein